jgi:hypothetical protein
VAFADERDDATRLAQRCHLRPHSTELLTQLHLADAAESMAQSNVFRILLREQDDDREL